MARTLYTPVLYTNTPNSATSNSSTNNIPQRLPAAYLDYLSRTHIALAQIVEELPASRCVSPLSGDDPGADSGDIHISQRALALRKQVQEAFDNAGGEPADGNWGSVARLLRLGVTRGRYRWVGARRDASRLESSIGWINAQNETEWFEWEKRKQDEERVKQKVESWKKTVDVEAEPPSDLGPMDASIITINDTSDEPRVGRLRENAKTVTISATRTLQRVKATAKSAGNGRDPKDPSPLGFTAAKRSSISVLEKKPQTPLNLGQNRDGALVSSTPSVKSNPMRQESSTDTPIIKRDLRRLITDIPETSFLPPSFPPQLATSTPVLQPESARQKPPPILLNSSPPLFLPQSPSMFDPQINEDSSSSQPPPMTSPSTRLAPNRNGKRPQVSVADQSPKRARIEAQSMPPADTCAPPNPTPLLVEVPDTVVPVTPKPKRLPTLTELLASSERSTKLGKRKPSPKLIFRELARRTSPGQPFHDIDPAIHEAQPAELETGESQQAHDEILSAPFEPMFTSTQQQHSQDPAPSGKIAGILRTDSMGWLGYNSQFDVDGQVDEVTRFMEKDVDCDQWLNVDPSPDG